MITGCAGSLQEQMGRFRWESVPAVGKIDANVRVEATVTYEDAQSRHLASGRETAISELLIEDLTASHLFTSVNAAGRTDYDLLVKIECAERDASGFFSAFIPKVTLSVLDPMSQKTIRQYTRENKVRYGGNWIERYRRTMSSMLGAIRSELLADYQARKLRVVVTGASPQTLPTALPLPTESNAPF